MVDAYVNLSPTDPTGGLAKRIVERFQALPGRHVEAGEAELGELLAVDPTVRSPGSPVLTPNLVRDPLKAGAASVVTARGALEAMISRSDNTATDVVLRRVGAARVRHFIASVGLKHTRIPDSTRQFFAYVAGAPNWQHISWDDLLDLLGSAAPPAHPILNPGQTMAVPPREFVSFYSRALQGEFFKNPALLEIFRAILSQAEAIPRVIPLGSSAFLKGGSIDFGAEHALSLAGGMVTPAGRWAYFGMIINWTGADGVAQVGPRFAAATRGIFTLLHERLGAR